MSASSSVIWRGLRRFLQALHIVSPRAIVETSATTTATFDPSPVKLTATIEIVSLIDELRQAEFIPIIVEPVELPLVEAARRPTLPHPIARQLAYTASRNVPKGRKAHPAPAPVLAGHRRPSMVKAKPVVVATVKKAPKRRHVWLCNQSRVVRPLNSNVVPLNGARTRTLKPAAQKTIRLLKLAA